eukprot:g2763.t1
MGKGHSKIDRRLSSLDQDERSFSNRRAREKQEINANNDDNDEPTKDKKLPSDDEEPENNEEEHKDKDEDKTFKVNEDSIGEKAKISKYIEVARQYLTSRTRGSPVSNSDCSSFQQRYPTLYHDFFEEDDFSDDGMQYYLENVRKYGAHSAHTTQRAKAIVRENELVRCGSEILGYYRKMQREWNTVDENADSHNEPVQDDSVEDEKQNVFDDSEDNEEQKVLGERAKVVDTAENFQALHDTNEENEEMKSKQMKDEAMFCCFQKKEVTTADYSTKKVREAASMSQTELHELAAPALTDGSTFGMRIQVIVISNNIDRFYRGGARSPVLKRKIMNNIKYTNRVYTGKTWESEGARRIPTNNGTYDFRCCANYPNIVFKWNGKEGHDLFYLTLSRNDWPVDVDFLCDPHELVHHYMKRKYRQFNFAKAINIIVVDTEPIANNTGSKFLGLSGLPDLMISDGLSPYDQNYCCIAPEAFGSPQDRCLYAIKECAQGKTMPHELGHVLNLYHTFSRHEPCCDTPPQVESSTRSVVLTGDGAAVTGCNNTWLKTRLPGDTNSVGAFVVSIISASSIEYTITNGYLVPSGKPVGNLTSAIQSFLFENYPKVDVSSWSSHSMINGTVLRYLHLEGFYIADSPLRLPSLFVLNLTNAIVEDGESLSKDPCNGDTKCHPGIITLNETTYSVVTGGVINASVYNQTAMHAIAVHNGKRNTIRNVRAAAQWQAAIAINGGTQNEVSNCDVGGQEGRPLPGRAIWTLATSRAYVHHNHVHHSLSHALDFDAYTTSSVSWKNLCEDNKDEGIFVEETASSNVIVDNICRRNANGIGVYSNAVGPVQGNLFFGNVVEDNSNMGITAGGMGHNPTKHSDSNTFFENTAQDNNNKGAQFNPQHGANIGDFWFSNNVPNKEIGFFPLPSANANVSIFQP